MSKEEASPFDVMDESVKFVATMTGVKRQFVDAGWSESVAERMVLALVSQYGKTKGEPDEHS